jgi:hypothetical protein
MLSKTAENNIKRNKSFFRKCLFYYECFRTEQHNGLKWQERWAKYKDGYICHRHYNLIVWGERRKLTNTDKRWRARRTKEARRKEHKERVSRLIYFKTKNIALSYIPKTGYCSKCSNNIYDGTCKKTHMHHKEYYIIFKWFCTEEICVSCHAYETWKTRKK